MWRGVSWRTAFASPVSTLTWQRCQGHCQLGFDATKSLIHREASPSKSWKKRATSKCPTDGAKGSQRTTAPCPRIWWDRPSGPGISRVNSTKVIKGMEASEKKATPDFERSRTLNPSSPPAPIRSGISGAGVRGCVRRSEAGVCNFLEGMRNQGVGQSRMAVRTPNCPIPRNQQHHGILQQGHHHGQSHSRPRTQTHF